MLRLFSLDPFGLGTEHIEAFDSYLGRLAAAHYCSVGLLFEHLVGGPLHLNTHRGPALVRPNLGNERILRLLVEHVRRPELRATTFQSLPRTLYRAIGALGDHVRWCVHCLKAQERDLGCSYVKLVWHLTAITHCAAHRTPLLEVCHSCGKPPQEVRYKHQQLVCWECRCPLSAGPASRKMRPSWVHPDADLLDLVAAIGSRPDIVFPDDGIDQILSALQRYSEQSPALATVSAELRAKDNQLYKRKTGTRVPLRIIRLIAFKLGISLVDALQGHVNWTDLLKPDWPLPKEGLAGYKRKHRDREEIVARMRAELARKYEGEPPSLKLTAKQIGASEGCMRHYAPAMCRRLVARHEKWIRHRTEECRKEAAKATAEIMRATRREGRAFSTGNCVEELRRITGISRNQARSVIRRWMARPM